MPALGASAVTLVAWPQSTLVPLSFEARNSLFCRCPIFYIRKPHVSTAYQLLSNESGVILELHTLVLKGDESRGNERLAVGATTLLLDGLHRVEEIKCATPVDVTNCADSDLRVSMGVRLRNP